MHMNMASCGKAIKFFVAVRVLEAFAGEVVDDCGSEYQWKLRMVGFSSDVRMISPLSLPGTPTWLGTHCNCRAQPLVSS
ncbi:hypothetical protein CDAR_420201 [Caerostris darwini]|uniref:Secreted protein n=1 Tax=Caerostris darwini TaxID=1538125 RepID=A0AAV4TU31_9ARAC|nr:hypothetical protein CDAR_420201 [Caerostris darwini]